MKSKKQDQRLMRPAKSVSGDEDGVTCDCTNCGACCRCFPIFASETDAGRELRIKTEGRLLPEHLQATDKVYQLFPLPFLEQCAFLKEDLLCRIYETRPEVCRRFEPGSEQCMEARARVGVGIRETGETR